MGVAGDVGMGRPPAVGLAGRARWCEANVPLGCDIRIGPGEVRAAVPWDGGPRPVAGRLDASLGTRSAPGPGTVPRTVEPLRAASVSTTAPAPPTAPGAPLGDVPGLLADEPGLAQVRGRRQAVLAAAESARSLTLAHLAGGTRTPLLVACPTTGDAERLVHDLGAYLGPDAVELFPAWETLPFERVSPAVETMGRRLRVVWRLRHGAHAPRVVVAPVRALVQRLGPHVDDVEPLIVRPGQQLDRDEVVATLVAAGYRREPQVEARGEVAVRGSIVDVFPSTEDRPIRIDLWGDEVDRLTEFSVTDQRATDPVRAAAVFPCRELLPTDDVRQRAGALVASQPWGREHWERLAEGLVFDGMESWLPWLTAR